MVTVREILSSLKKIQYLRIHTYLYFHYSLQRYYKMCQEYDDKTKGRKYFASLRRTTFVWVGRRSFASDDVRLRRTTFVCVGRRSFASDDVRLRRTTFVCDGRRSFASDDVCLRRTTFVCVGRRSFASDDVRLRWTTFVCVWLQRKCTPIHVACKRGHVTIAMMLLQAGCSMDAKDQVRGHVTGAPNDLRGRDSGTLVYRVSNERFVNKIMTINFFEVFLLIVWLRHDNFHVCDSY